MTDRWKDALRDIDDVGPDESVYRRAAQGPTRSDLPPPPNRSSRIVAGVTAFAVFAFAAAFGWQAFRPESIREGPPPGTAPVSVRTLPLWPERDLNEAVSAQAASVSDPELAWRLDPAEVVRRFAQQIMGWSDPGVSQTGAGTFAVGPCPKDAACDTQYTLSLSVEVVQPVDVGSEGIWSVSSVTGTGLDIGADPADVLANGSRVAVAVDPAALTPTYLPGSLELSSGFSVDNAGCGGGGQGAPESLVGATEFRIEVATTCAGDAPGYVWTALSPPSRGDAPAPLADPLDGRTSLVSLSIVPIVARQGGATLTESGTVPYVDPLGWRVDYPVAWTVTPIATQDRVTTTGAAFSNVTPGVASPNAATPSPVGLDPDNVPPDAVEIVITHLEGGPMPDLTTDDTRFPVRLDGLGCPLDSMLLCGSSLRGGGLDYSIEVRRGANASPEDVAAAEALVASMRFRSLRLGEQAHGWASLGRPALYPQGEGSPALAGRLGVVYVMRGPQGTYALDLNPDGCGEGENETWDPKTLQIWVQCPAYLGTGDMRYDRFGQPDPTNAPKFRAPLEAHPVITAWDGSLLVYLDGSMDQLPQLYWP
jgi:hypothetical protein